jgi:seryl-tRNA synthetase
MLDINLIRENPDLVAEKLARRGYTVDFADFLARDARRRQLIFTSESLKAEKNKTSAEIPKLKKAGQDVQPIFDRMKQIADQIHDLDTELSALEAEQQAFLDALPNLPADDVAAGGKENNRVVDVYGESQSSLLRPDIMWTW